MSSFKYTKEPRQRYPGDRQWKNNDVPKSDDKKSNGQ